jgi:hypothetical protein
MNESGLSYLRSVQEPDGGFKSFSSQSKHFKQQYTYQTTFVPALILNTLSGIEEKGVVTIRKKLADHLLKQRSPHWSFNYWTRESEEQQTLPYPDDLDDTFCALVGLYRHDPSLIDAAALAEIVKLLIATETSPGGPYRTWLVPATSPKAWLDVDLAVNAVVAYFLSLIGSPLPNLQEFMDSAIKKSGYSSPYYPSMYPIIYYLARAYDGPEKPRLAEALLQQQNAQGHWDTPLQTSLAISSLRHLGINTDLSKARKFLLDAQAPNGAWPAEAFCIDPQREGKTHYHGAAALTTALAIESLYTPEPKKQPLKSTQSEDKQADEIYQAVVEQARAYFGRLDTDLRREALGFLERLLAGDKKREIVLLPYFFLSSFKQASALSKKSLASLGSANLYGWIAYTIYDDFLDDEGDPKLLSVANVCLRASLTSFQEALPGHTDFQEKVLQTFDKIDAANTWEVTHCRFASNSRSITIGRMPAYGRLSRLAERSLGHTLPPIAVLAASGKEVFDPAVQAVESSLKHYIIARQLSDDLHDWEDDLRAGHITFVVRAILQDLSIKPGQQKLEPLIIRMQKQFWNHTLNSLCDQVLRHLKAAKRAQEPYLKPENIITKLLDGIEASVDETLKQQSEAKQFIKSYRKGPPSS